MTDGREMFASQKLKDAIIKRAKKRRISNNTRWFLCGHYAHYIIKNRLDWLAHSRQNQYPIDRW